MSGINYPLHPLRGTDLFWDAADMLGAAADKFSDKLGAAADKHGITAVAMSVYSEMEYLFTMLPKFTAEQLERIDPNSTFIDGMVMGAGGVLALDFGTSAISNARAGKKTKALGQAIIAGLSTSAATYSAFRLSHCAGMAAAKLNASPGVIDTILRGIGIS